MNKKFTLLRNVKIYVILGVSTIRSIIPKVCAEVGLKEKGYTNHSIRATTLTIFAQHMIPIQHQKKISGHRSDAAVESYSSRLSEKNTIILHDELQAALGGNPINRDCKRGYRECADIEETITLSQTSSDGTTVEAKRVKHTKTQILEELTGENQENLDPTVVNRINNSEASAPTSVLITEDTEALLHEPSILTILPDIYEFNNQENNEAPISVTTTSIQPAVTLPNVQPIDIEKALMSTTAPIFHGCVFNNTSFPPLKMLVWGL